ncbi:MAG TPA: MFS transporter [Lachnospiraceae bacterium]|nr:MFS transporter [Lachnospiraceae bacterium]
MTTEAKTSAEKQVEEIRKQTSFLGHPKGIGTLSFMQLCNSFASYGMSAILVYYLYAAAPGGLGLAKESAAQLVSLYSAVSILTGLVGSYVADRILGPRKALGISRIVQTLAYACLAIPFLDIYGYAASQFLLCFAAMLVGRSLDALVGKCYDLSDKRRDGAYTITYIISNIGAAAPVISGSVALATGYNVAFALSAVFAGVGTIAYYMTEKKFFGPIGLEPDDPIPDDQKKAFMTKFIGAVIVVIVVLAALFMTGTLSVNKFANFMSTAAIFIPIIYLVYIIKSKKTTKEEAKHVMYLIPLFICNCFAMLVWTQSTSILAIYAEESVNRNLFGIEITPAAFQTLPAIIAIIWGSVVTALWTKLGDRQLSAPGKIGYGTVLWGLGPLFMIIPFSIYGPGEKASPLWLIIFYVIIILGEAFTSPVGYSSASLVAPKAFATQMITVWSLSQSTGAALSTLAVNFYKEGSESIYFLMIGGLTCIVGLAVGIMRNKIAKGMGLNE